MLAADDFLSSPTNSLFATTPNESIMKQKFYHDSPFDQNITFSDVNCLLNNEEGIASAVSESLTKFNCLSSNIVLQNLQNYTNQQNENNYLLFENNLINLKKWSTIDYATVTKIPNDSQTIKNKSSEETDSLRRASDSSLGSTGGAGITTPSTTASSQSSDELWNNTSNLVANNEANNQHNAAAVVAVASVGGIRLPVFEQISNGPF